LAKKLYVGNLGYNVTSSELETMFAAFGTVQSAQVIEDRDTGRSKGFAFVEMGSEQEAQAAIQGLNGQEHDGRPLAVNEARPREERSGGGGGRGGRGGYGGGGGGGGGRRGGRY
jgi:RNA recognition motif-containing protein